MNMLLQMTTLVLLCIQRVASFPKGASPKSCISMSPREGHGKSKIGEKAYPERPYQLLVTNLTYGPEQHIKVILTGEQNFKGFMVQARSMRGLSDVPMGRFIDPYVGSKVMSCSLYQSADNAWTHIDNYYKSDMSATWVAPSMDEGTIFFRATVVKGRFDYWENIFSDLIDYNGPVIQQGSETNWQDKPGDIPNDETGAGTGAGTGPGTGPGTGGKRCDKSRGGTRHSTSIITLMFHVILVSVLVTRMF